MSAYTRACEWLIETYSFWDGFWRIVVLLGAAAAVIVGTRATKVSGEITSAELRNSFRPAAARLWTLWLQLLPVLVVLSLIIVMFPTGIPRNVVLVSRARRPVTQSDPAPGIWSTTVTGIQSRQWIDAGIIVDKVLLHLQQSGRIWSRDDPDLENIVAGAIKTVLNEPIPKFERSTLPSLLVTTGVSTDLFPTWLLESIEITTLRLLGASYNVRSFFVISSDRRTRSGVDAWELADTLVCTKPTHAFVRKSLPVPYPVQLLSLARREDDLNGQHVTLTSQFRIAKRLDIRESARTAQLKLYGARNGRTESVTVSDQTFVPADVNRIEIRRIVIPLPDNFAPTILEQVGSPPIQLDVPPAGRASSDPLRIGLVGPQPLVKRWQATLDALKSPSPQLSACAEFISGRMLDVDSTIFSPAPTVTGNAGTQFDVLINVGHETPVTIYSSRIETVPLDPAFATAIRLPRNSTTTLRALNAPAGQGLAGRFGWDRVPLVAGDFRVFVVPPPDTDVVIRSLSSRLSQAHESQGRDLALVWRTQVAVAGGTAIQEITWIGFDPVQQGCLASFDASFDEARFGSFWSTVFAGIVRATSTTVGESTDVDLGAPQILLESSASDRIAAMSWRWWLLPTWVSLLVYGAFAYRGVVNAPGGRT
jgi:hypothetical protein